MTPTYTRIHPNATRALADVQVAEAMHRGVIKCAEDAPLSAVVGAITKRLASVGLPPGYTITQGGETESQAEVFGRIFVALGVAVLLMYLILVIQFGSFLDPLAILMSLLMWGVVYQGYNAVFPSFYPELFPTRTRVSSMAISQNIGTTITALLPALFAAVAPPGATNIPMTIGAIAFGITAVAAAAAFSARETYRVHMDDLGDPNAQPVPKPEYDRMRGEAVAAAGAA